MGQPTLLYVGEGFKKEQWCLLFSLPIFSHHFHYPQSNWALLVLIPRLEGLCTFKDPVGLSNELSCELSFNSVSILITSILNCASDSLAISSSCSCIFFWSFDLFFLWAIFFLILVCLLQ